MKRPRFAAYIPAIVATVVLSHIPAFAQERKVPPGTTDNAARAAAATAWAAVSAKKPSVCRHYIELRDGRESFLVCKDGKRPSVWTGSYAIVKCPWGETLAVGYRSPRR